VFDVDNCIRFFESKNNIDAVFYVKKYYRNIKRLLNGEIISSTNKQKKFLELFEHYKKDSKTFISQKFTKLEPELKIWFICLIREDKSVVKDIIHHDVNYDQWFTRDDWKKMRKWRN
tara:strand:+ start:517 stop:867 length:351 start_codon:yes stop_codon:yes gene_type:complete